MMQTKLLKGGCKGLRKLLEVLATNKGFKDWNNVLKHEIKKALTILLIERKVYLEIQKIKLFKAALSQKMILCMPNLWPIKTTTSLLKNQIRLLKWLRAFNHRDLIIQKKTIKFKTTWKIPSLYHLKTLEITHKFSNNLIKFRWIQTLEL